MEVFVLHILKLNIIAAVVISLEVFYLAAACGNPLCSGASPGEFGIGGC